MMIAKIILGWLTVFTLILLPVHKVSAQFLESDHLGHEKWEYMLEDTGDVLQLALPISTLSVTLIKGDYEGTKQFAYSYGSAMILTHSLKYLINKQRPEGRDRYDSFPSGHTASAFSGASFIHKRYGFKYGWPGYVLATLVGVSRMEGPDGYHDIWDVIAGASVGISTTYLFTSKYARDHFELGFASGDGSYILSFNYTF